MKSSSIFWSIFLICVGLIFLMREFDAFPYPLDFVFNLWPVVFILWGLSMFKIPQFIKKTLVGLSGLIAALFVMAVVTHDYNPGCSDRVHVSVNPPSDDDEYYDEWDSLEVGDDYNEFQSNFDTKINTARLNLEAGAGKFVIRDSSSLLIEGSSRHIASDLSVWLASEDSTRAIVDLNMAFGNMNNKKDKSGHIKLSPKPIWDIDLSMGAGKFIGDFRELKVKDIAIDAGAAKVEVIVGNKQDSVDIDVGAGMAKVLIRVPKEMGCKILDGDDFFVSKELKGFITKGNDHYSPNFDTTDTRVFIRMEGGMAKFEVIRY